MCATCLCRGCHGAIAPSRARRFRPTIAAFLNDAEAVAGASRCTSSPWDRASTEAAPTRRCNSSDEDPASPSFKQPLTGREFDGTPHWPTEWNDYIEWWQHRFMYIGRLRHGADAQVQLSDGEAAPQHHGVRWLSISESHSGLADYATLAFPPDPNRNGHRTGKTWQELYPHLFTRPEGPRPDLVIFGSGANEKGGWRRRKWPRLKAQSAGSSGTTRIPSSSSACSRTGNATPRTPVT